MHARFFLGQCRVAARSVARLLCLVALAGALAPLSPARAAVEPLLTLTPNQGPCGAPVTARGANFPPGDTVELNLPRDPKQPPSYGSVKSTATVAADGTFAVEIVPCTAETPGYDQDGTQYFISAIVQGPYQDGPRVPTRWRSTPSGRLPRCRSPPSR